MDLTLQKQKSVHEHNAFQKIVDRPPIKSLIAIGNPIIDITAEVDMETIEKYGLLWGKTLFLNENNKGFFDELEKKPKVTTTPGGSIQNTLRVCAWCLSMTDDYEDEQFKLTMLGCCGDDLYKEKIKTSMDIAGVKTLYATVPHLNTSRCAVGINKKERTLLSDIRASKSLSKEYVEKNINEIMSHEAIVIEGYFLQENFELCKELATSFSKQGKTVMLTLSAVFMVNSYKSRMIEIANLSNVVIGNMEECEALLEEEGFKKKREEIFREIHKNLERKNRILVMTAGKDGVFISKFNYDRNELDFVLQSFANLIENKDIVDLNGAGDSFLGGFISQYMRGKPLLTCAKAGNDAASVILRNVGCTFNNHIKIDFED